MWIMLTVSSPETGFNLSLVFITVLSSKSELEPSCSLGMLRKYRLVVGHHRFMSAYLSHLRGCLMLQMAPIGCPKHWWVATNRCSVTSKKRKGPNYTAVEAWTLKSEFDARMVFLDICSSVITHKLHRAHNTWFHFTRWSKLTVK